MFYSSIKVFKEIVLADQILFQHYRVATESEMPYLGYIVPAELLNELEHWSLMQGCDYDDSFNPTLCTNS